MSYQVEAYIDGALFSGYSQNYYTLEANKTIVICFPRAFTPICGNEIDELEQKQKELADSGWRVVVASQDTPEAFSEWKRNTTLDFVRLSRDFFDQHKETRHVVWIKNDKVVKTIFPDIDTSRDFNKLIKTTRSL